MNSLGCALARMSCVLVLCVQLHGPALSLQAPTSQSGQRPTFGAEVTRVRVDVVAVDDAGRFVDDLEASDLVVFEDGEPQEIISIQLVDVREGRVYDPEALRQVGNTAPLAPLDSAAGEDAPRAKSDLGAVIYLVDGLGLSARNQVRFSMRWSAELAKRQDLAVPHALYRIDRVGQVREIVSLTEDISGFRTAVDELAELADTDLFRNLRIREPSLQRYDLLKQFCEALAGRSGRTVLVFVSTGVSLMKGGWPDTRVLKLQEEMHETANGANVSFYSLDPSLMYELVGTGVDASRQGGSSVRTRAGSRRDELGNSLRHAAAATGGQAFIGWAALDRVLDIIERDTSRYYLLTYSPRRAHNDGAYHALNVEVTRPGVSLRFRQGYIDDSREVRENKRLSGALALPGATGSVPMIVETVRGRSASGEPIHLVRVSASAEAFQAALSGDDTHVVRVTAHIGVVTDDGDTVLLRRELLTHPVGGLRNGDEPEGGAESPSTMISHSEVISLPPGDYELKVVLVDENSDRIGADSLEFSVPPADEPWPTSSVRLVSQPYGESPRPVLGGRAAFGDRVTAMLDVYEPGDVELSAHLIAQDGSAVPSDDLPLTMERDAGGVVSVSIEIPSLAVGEYVLEVQVSGSDSTEVLRTAVWIVPR